MQELHVKSLLPVRLDKYLMEQFPALGLGRLNKALRENKIKLNGKKQPLATRVQNGDVIRVYLLDDQLGLTSQEGPEFLQARAPAEFIYENDDLIVANKPAGIPVDGDESDTTQGLYGFVAFLMSMGRDFATDGPLMLGIGLGVGLVCLFSAIRQGQICASGIVGISQGHDVQTNTMIYAALPEFYAILALVAALMV